MNKMTKTALAVAALISAPSFAGYTLDVGNDASVTFGGYIKAEALWENGDPDGALDLSASETRFNSKYVQGDVTGFIELDFRAGLVSGNATPRLRHAFIKYNGFTMGQTWTTLTPLAAIPDTISFGSSIYNNREAMVRYEANGFAVALEDPGRDQFDAEVPDLAVKYTLKQDWGQVTVGGLVFEDVEEDTETSFSVWGKIKTFGKDDFRFYYVDDEEGGLLEGVGRYRTQESQYSVAYRHFWTDDLRTTGFYQQVDAEVAANDYEHYGLNLIKQVTKALSVGIEIGERGLEANDDNEYVQVMARFVL